MAENGVISAKQAKAVAALLACNSVTDAADVSGVGLRTLSRWLTERQFQAALSEAEGAAIDHATRRLTALSDTAVSVLQDSLSGEVAPYVRLKAAQGVLDYLLRLRELRGLERRLSALEEAITDVQAS